MTKLKNLTHKEILQKSNFDNIYNNLKNANYILLASYKEITTNKDITYSSTVSKYTSNNPQACDYGKNYLTCNHYGSYSFKLTKADFKTLLTKFYNDCNYFVVMNIDDYYNAENVYFDEQFKEQQKQLDALVRA